MNLSKEQLWKAMKQPGGEDRDCCNCKHNFSPDETMECNNCYEVTGELSEQEKLARPLHGFYWEWDEGNPVKNPYE